MTPFFDVWDNFSQNKHVKKVIGTNITALYSALTIAYFFTQILVLISVLDANHSAGSSLEAFLNKAHVSTGDEFSYLDSFNGEVRLRICPEGVTKSAISQCPVVFPIDNMRTPVPASSSNAVISSQYVKRDGDELTLVPVFQDSNLTGFMVLDPSQPGDIVSLAPVCLQALDWPYQRLIQYRRVDVTVACFQVALLIVSAVAIFNQSFASAATSCIMHLLALAQSSWQTSDIQTFQTNYARLVTSSTGACNGFDMLATFFTTRHTYAIAMTVVNVVAALISGYLTWRLVAPYGMEALKTAGVTQKVRVAWMTAQALFSATQLCSFFFIASVGIWLDEITKHIMGARPSLLPLCLAFYILSVILVVPWLSLAPIAVVRESAKFMIAFFVLSGVYLVGSGVMFVSATFRQTFIHWSFFGAMFSLSYTFVVAMVVLAVLCRLNFGTEVMEYLRASTGGKSEGPYSATDEKGNLKRLTLADRGQFVVSLPGQGHVENPPKRWASLSSNSSSNSSRSDSSKKSRTSRIMAAQPGAIRITPPMPAATPTTLSPANSLSLKPKSTRKYGERPFWGKANKRHESAMSFGHMDPSRLTLSSSMQVSELAQNLPAQPAPAPRVDSVGSIYSTQSKKMRLFLVTDL